MGFTKSQLLKEYNNVGGGFVLSFDGYTDGNFTIAWKDLVDKADMLMLFGRPFASTRPFDVIFRNRKNLQYVHHIFRQLSTELRGDSVASSQLYAAYQKHARYPLLPCVGTIGLHLFGRCLGNISTSSVTCISWIP